MSDLEYARREIELLITKARANERTAPAPAAYEWFAIRQTAENVLAVIDPQDRTLRDWFAGQALAHFRLHDWSDNPLYWEGIARSAYCVADAMLAERNK